MTGACFKNTILIQANFRQATGLSAAGLEEAARLDNCQLSTQSLSRNDTKALKEKGTIEFTVDQQDVSLSSLGTIICCLYPWRTDCRSRAVTRMA